MADVPDIVEVDEDADIEHVQSKPVEQPAHSDISDHPMNKPDGLAKSTREVTCLSTGIDVQFDHRSLQLSVIDASDAQDESARGSANKPKRERSADKNKVTNQSLFFVFVLCFLIVRTVDQS
jgi:hypothetical protein